MENDDFNQMMRTFEYTHDPSVLPGIYIVARLDGRSFTRLTKEVHPFDAPFDERFRDMMLDTTEYLMTCGFPVTYAYTQSDEISLLFTRDVESFGRKLRKFNSTLAGEASAKFSLLLGGIGTFDCRVSQLPDREYVVDYFRWRQADATRNALNAHCYWHLRNQGQSATQADRALVGLSTSDRNELLFSLGVNFNDLPNWQKRGMGLHWETYLKQGLNPITGEETTSKPRRRIIRNSELPMKDEYDLFIRSLLKEDLE